MGCRAAFGLPDIVLLWVRLKTQNRPLYRRAVCGMIEKKEGRSPIMSKHILVCLPISAEQRARIEAVQGFA